MQKIANILEDSDSLLISTKLLNKIFSKNYFSLTNCEFNFFTDPTFTNYFSVCNAATILQGRSLRNFR